MAVAEVSTVQFALPKELQPPGANFLDRLELPRLKGQYVIPICFACHRDYALPDYPQIVGLLLDNGSVDWEVALAHFIAHQEGRTRQNPSHGTIVEQVDHRIILLNAGVIFRR